MNNADYHIYWRPIVWLIVVSAVTLGSPTANAEIYKFVKNGVVHYTDRPPSQVAYSSVGSASTASSASSKKITLTSTVKAPKYSSIITRVARTYGISSELIKAIIKVESNYNARAVSPKGARGLMQLMPDTAKRFGVSDSFDPEQNIVGGVKFLRFLFEEFGENNLDLVLAGYNAGEQAVKKHNDQIPPYRETKQYVKKVMALYNPAAPSAYKHTKTSTIYRYVNKNGTVTFTNVRRAF
jgi:soluble lytic murein transglycosylase-like protein